MDQVHAGNGNRRLAAHHRALIEQSVHHVDQRDSLSDAGLDGHYGRAPVNE